MSSLPTDTVKLLITSIRDAIGVTISAVVQLLTGDILSPRRLLRIVLELMLAGFLLIAPAIADVQYLSSSSNRTRSYWVHAPENLKEGQKYPAVIMFHGGGRIGSDADGLAMELDLRMSLPLVQTVYSTDKYFIYPNGVGGVWAGPTYAEVSVEEDLRFVSDMIDDLKSKYSIDSNRIYAAGMSNGGGFVDTIACSELGSKFAAFASVAGSFYTSVNGYDCLSARSPLPFLEIHGGLDKGVHYAGGMGYGGPLPPIPVWLDDWAKRNKCTSNSTAHSIDGNVHHTSWTCGGQRGILQHWKVDANGHDWPSKSRNINMLVAGMGPQPIEANELIIDFFNRYSLT